MPVALGDPRVCDEGQEGGVLVPVAMALWARVSSRIDKALSENLDQAVRLKPGDLGLGRQDLADGRGRR